VDGAIEVRWLDVIFRPVVPIDRYDPTAIANTVEDTDDTVPAVVGEAG
jgi:hypothetical protein